MRPRRPRVLVLVPTRELANQVAREIVGLMPERRKSVVEIYGGVGYGPQIQKLRSGASVVVACPGRLEDLIAQGHVDLDDVSLVVVDEADRMADMGFLPAVRRLLDRTRPDRQTLLFSATLDGDVDTLVRRYQRDPVRHDVTSDDDYTDDTEHLFWRVTRDQRVAVTADLVQMHGSAMVFCRTRHGADKVVRQLGAAGLNVVAIHGGRSQSQRQQALNAFAAGRVQALVATDVAARGIHVDDVGCVVHFDTPADAKDYLHRSGRTGRAGTTGTVVSLVTDEEHRDHAKLRRSLGRNEPIEAPGPAPRRHLHQSNHQSKGSKRMPTGTVKFFNSEKGYGFIARPDGDDVFVHFSNIEGSGYRNLETGQEVEFEIGQGRKGDEALKVRAL